MLRLALDQNFPTTLIEAVRPYLPDDIELRHVNKIDERLSGLGDRELIIALHQLDWNGLITNDARILRVPEEVAAVVKTKCVLVTVEGLGHDPLRAAGVLLVELPTLRRRLRPDMSNVFRLKLRARQPVDAWESFQEAAQRRNKTAATLWSEVQVSDEELSTLILRDRLDL